MGDAEKPDEQEAYPQDAHFHALGRCINQWAMLEQMLFMLCEFALATRFEIAAIVFHRNVNLRPKLELVIELLLATELSEQDRTDWEKLSGEIRDLIPMRNKLAHWPLIGFVALRRDADGRLAPRIVDAGIRRAQTDLARPSTTQRQREEPRITWRELETHFEVVKTLTADLKAVTERIRRSGKAQPPATKTSGGDSKRSRRR